MKRQSHPDQSPCPCGGRPAGQPYATCCGRWHLGPGHLQAPDAEALMRSRYSAYVLGRVDYLLDTWHPRTRPASLDLDAGLHWLGLEVRSAVTDGDGQARVAFVARSKSGGRAHRLVEDSRFLRDGERWYYLDAVAPT